jgi:hypothetical protein
LTGLLDFVLADPLAALVAVDDLHAISPGCPDFEIAANDLL